jgi:poly(3-hydroxybutyrate) depolymerase
VRVLAVVAACSLAAPAAAAAGVRTLTFTYRTHGGAHARAHLVLPSWYGPARHPRIPFVISPHGRGVSGAYNLRFWGSLADRGGFAVVSPDGHGRKLPFYSWGWTGQIDDLARMPALARAAYGWLRIDPGRVYAIGDSMGAQEVLLLAATRKLRLAGVAAFDPVTDMAARYRVWGVTPGEERLPALARIEFGGTPQSAPALYAARSPIAKLRAIARSNIPLQLWWSRRDAVVTDEREQTQAFFARLIALAPAAPVQEIVGYWQHAHAFHPETQLPLALACFDLLPVRGLTIPAFAREADGSIAELPPEAAAAPVPFTRAFCSR